jgi:hypothetical protein
LWRDRFYYDLNVISIGEIERLWLPLRGSTWKISRIFFFLLSITKVPPLAPKFSSRNAAYFSLITDSSIKESELILQKTVHSVNTYHGRDMYVLVWVSGKRFRWCYIQHDSTNTRNLKTELRNLAVTQLIGISDVTHLNPTHHTLEYISGAFGYDFASQRILCLVIPQVNACFPKFSFLMPSNLLPSL